MSMGFLLEPESAVIMRGPMLHGIMQQFLHQVEWGELDYLVIDLPPGTGDVPLTLAQSLPLTGAVVVCTPQEVALLDATAPITMFRQLKVPMLGMIENMSFFDVAGLPQGRGGPRAAQRLSRADYLFGPPATSAPTSSAAGAPAARPSSSACRSWARSRSNINVRERGDEGRSRRPSAPGSRSRPYLLGVVEQLAAQISIQNIKTPKMPKPGDPRLAKKSGPLSPFSGRGSG